MHASLSLLLDLYELTMAQCYLRHRKETRATFDLFVRDLPLRRAYLIACGLEDILSYIKELRFSTDDLAYLRRQEIFSKDFLAYLSKFKFTGDVWAFPEGTVFFPQEPVIRVTAPLIEAQIIESFLLNTINLQTMIASKASRVVSAAGDKGVYDFSLRRTHGQDAAVKVARASFLAGFHGTSNVFAGKRYRIPIVGTMAHSFVMSFPSEKESFSAYSNMFPERSILLVDTYDTKIGIKNAVSVGLALKRSGHTLLGVRIDSGDIVRLSQAARKALDKAGLKKVKIFASGNLDEDKISHMRKAHAAVDNFGVGTNMGVSADAPFLDVSYKISEVTDGHGRFMPTMKLSKGKVTFPGRKQVFRCKDKKGHFLKDILALEDEGIAGTPLLKKVVEKGKIIYNTPRLGQIRQDVQESLRCLPAYLLQLKSQRRRYPVVISKGLRKLTKGLSYMLSLRQ